jgi:hypothetical protein
MKKPAVCFIFLLGLSGCATTKQFVPFPDQAKDVVIGHVKITPCGH